MDSALQGVAVARRAGLAASPLLTWYLGTWMEMVRGRERGEKEQRGGCRSHLFCQLLVCFGMQPKLFFWVAEKLGAWLPKSTALSRQGSQRRGRGELRAHRLVVLGCSQHPAGACLGSADRLGLQGLGSAECC